MSVTTAIVKRSQNIVKRAINTVTKRVESWNVVLLNDQQHTPDYVENLAYTVCGKDYPTAWDIAREVNNEGEAVVFSGMTREEAREVARQIRAAGPDRLALACGFKSEGSMNVRVEACYDKSQAKGLAVVDRY